MIEKIPAVGASDEQLELLRDRLQSLFPVTPEIEPRAEVVEYRDPFLERVALVGEIVWYWPESNFCRAAIVTYTHIERHGGGVDLMIFERRGFTFATNVRRGRFDRGWTPRGSLE